MKKLSIIIPVYNVESYLSHCLESVINETYKNKEIILIDDGSTDNSGKICDDYSKKYDFIKVIHKKNGGVSSARNVGIKISTGKYISFIDSDDFISREMYSKMILKIEENDSDACICGFTYVYSNDNIKNRMIKNKKDIIYNENIAIDVLCGKINAPTAIWNYVFKTSFLKENGAEYFDENLSIGEDQEWLSRILIKLRKLSIIRECLYNYFVRENSAMRKKNINDTELTSKFMILKNLENAKFNNKKIINHIKGQLFITAYNIQLKKYLYTIEYNNYDIENILKSNIKYFINYNIALKLKIKYLLILFFIRIKLKREFIKRMEGSN